MDKLDFVSSSLDRASASCSCRSSSPLLLGRAALMSADRLGVEPCVVLPLGTELWYHKGQFWAHRETGTTYMFPCCIGFLSGSQEREVGSLRQTHKYKLYIQGCNSYLDDVGVKAPEWNFLFV